MNLLINLAKNNLNICQVAYSTKANTALDTVQPEEPLPPYIGRVGDNLAGVEITMINGVPYVRSLVADFLIDTLNKLNNLGTLMKPNLEQGINVISDNRFEMTKSLFALKEFLDTNFALTDDDPVNVQFSKLNATLMRQLDGPIVQLIGFMVPNLVKMAAPILQAAPPAQVENVFKQIAVTIGGAISGANTCIPVVSNYATEAIVSAHSTANILTQYLGALTKRVMPRLFTNIQSVADQSARNVGACMRPFSEMALVRFAEIQRGINYSDVYANVNPESNLIPAVAVSVPEPIVNFA